MQRKCLFTQQQIEYVGHLVSAGVKADPNKIVVLSNWPVPRNLRELRDFLGLTGYYRRFVAGCGTIVRPLTNQLKKDAFGWNDEAEATFHSLKRAMTTFPGLALLGFS